MDEEPRTPIPYRRLIFTGFIVLVMALMAAGAVAVGLNLVGDEGEDAPLGTITLVVAPAVIVITNLSNILMGLLRDDKH